MENLLNRHYGEISEIDKETVRYLLKQIRALNWLVQITEIPLKIIVQEDYSRKEYTEEQKLYFRDNCSLIHYFSRTSDESSEQ